MIGQAIITIAALALLAVLFYLYFNKNPVRTIPPGKSIVSPADGKIIEVIDLLELKRKKKSIKIKKGWFGKIKTLASEVSDHCYVICIFICPFDVHVQRAPVEGKVVSVKRTKGKFLSANSLEAALENEKVETVIKNKDIGKVKVIQVAGFFTRSIESFLKKNENLLKGQRIGRIKLGSQVVLIMPDLPLTVKKGERVVAGETIIAEYE